jgi:hypothetical protein
MLIIEKSQSEIWNHGSCFNMGTLTSWQLFLLMAMPAAAVMFLGAAWIGDDIFIKLRMIDNLVNSFGLRSVHYSRVYEATSYGGRK